MSDKRKEKKDVDEIRRVFAEKLRQAYKSYQEITKEIDQEIIKEIDQEIINDLQSNQ